MEKNLQPTYLCMDAIEISFLFEFLLSVRKEEKYINNYDEFKRDDLNNSPFP